jgi:serine/threonine protein phosphatase PrpC
VRLHPAFGLPEVDGGRPKARPPHHGQGQVVNWDDYLVGAATDTGLRRSNNQDSHAVVPATNQEVWAQRGHLFMVADGMGAHAVGELASKLACDNIPHHYAKSKKDTPVEAITKAFRQVGALIHGKATANKDFAGMGTTCSSLILLPQGALIAHVGDSRVYRIRGPLIEQFSFDHSLVWELIRRNHLSAEDDSRAIPKNVITRSLGPDPAVEVDIEGPLAVQPGDAFLICSDGLSGPVTDPELGALAASFAPEDACRYSVQLANLRGGHDNITVVIVRIGPWIDPDHPAASNGAAAPTEARRGLMSRLGGMILGGKSRKEVEAVEEKPYRTATTEITPGLLDTLEDLVRRAQAAAVEQAWTVDWIELSNYRRQIAEARKAGNMRQALRGICESIVVLGQAARLHRKAGGPAVVI